MNPGRVYLIVAAVAGAVLYGGTYQQFRSFTLESPGGATDAIHYVAMAQGTVSEGPGEDHYYRWITPAAASMVAPFCGGEAQWCFRLSFYAVNFAFSLAACLVFFAVLHAIGFSRVLSVVGVCAFASSRVTTLATATPLVDAAYFLAITVLLYLIITRRVAALAVSLPLLVLVKQPMLAFVLLPLLTDLRRSPAIWASLALVPVAHLVNAAVVNASLGVEGVTLTATVADHLATVPDTAARLITLAGLHDLQHGFFLLLPLAAWGWWLNRRSRQRHVPLVIVATIPISFGLAMLSGNLGQQFFAAFPAVVAYALIAVEHATISAERAS